MPRTVGEQTRKYEKKNEKNENVNQRLSKQFKDTSYRIERDFRKGFENRRLKQTQIT